MITKKEAEKILEALRIHQTLLVEDSSLSVKEGLMNLFQSVWKLFKKYIAKNLPNVTLYKPQNQKRMRRNRELNTWEKKDLARRKYADRQLEKFIKWSIETKGYLKYKELIEYERKYFNRNAK